MLLLLILALPGNFSGVTAGEACSPKSKFLGNFAAEHFTGQMLKEHHSITNNSKDNVYGPNIKAQPLQEYSSLIYIHLQYAIIYVQSLPFIIIWPES